MLVRTLFAATAGVTLSAVATPSALAQTPLLSYDFNETGTVAIPGGSAAAGAPDLRLERGNTAADLHSAPGTGVSGQPFDTALDVTNAGIVGGTNTARARHTRPGEVFSQDYDAIDALGAFTLSGFFKTDGDQAIGNSAILITNFPLLFGSAGYRLQGGPGVDSGTLRLTVDNLSVVSPAVYTEPAGDDYAYFAVTYDGSATTDNVQFFVGGDEVGEVATLAGTLTLNAGPVNQETVPLLFGNTESSSDSADSLLDNFRIYDTVLSAASLESTRLGDVVPEPTSLAVIAVGGGLALLRRRRQA